MSQKPISKALIYCRVSSRSQEQDGRGLESQETRCRQFAVSKGMEIAAVFPDTFTGAGNYIQRPGMVALLSYIDAQPDERFVVIFDDLKRASRDTRAFLDLRDAFRSRGVQVECLNFKFEDSPEGEFIETIMAVQGALERKQNGRQVAQKMKARMQSGYWIHTAPVGYNYETVKGRGKLLTFDEPLASTVREAFEGYASGRFQTQVEVKRFFDAHAAFPRNGKGEITQQRVTDILTHPLYTGHICSDTYNIHWLKGHHPALISLETFENVQERRKSIAKVPTRKDVGQDFALRGFVTCGDCDQPYTACWSKGKYKKYPYYLCDTKGCASYRKSIPRARIEGDFEAILHRLQPAKMLVDMVTAMGRTAWQHREVQAVDSAIALKREVTGLDKQIDGLLTRLLGARNSSVVNAYEAKIAELDRKKAILIEKSHAAKQPKGKVDDFIELFLQFLASPWKL